MWVLFLFFCYLLYFIACVVIFNLRLPLMYHMCQGVKKVTQRHGQAKLPSSPLKPLSFFSEWSTFKQPKNPCFPTARCKYWSLGLEPFLNGYNKFQLEFQPLDARDKKGRLTRSSRRATTTKCRSGSWSRGKRRRTEMALRWCLPLVSLSAVTLRQITCM